MSDPIAELRRDPIRGHHVLISPTRSLRSTDYSRPPQIVDLTHSPFLPGLEDRTPPEIDSVRPNNSLPDSPGWSARVFPNMYASLSLEPAPIRRAGGSMDLFSATEAFGAQEVMVISPEPGQELAGMRIEEIDRIFSLVQHRLVSLSRDPRVHYCLLFQNRGPEAGASRHHPHFQLYAMELLPPGVADMRVRARQHFRDRESSIFDDMVAAELENGRRVVRADSSFVTFAPFASRVPYELMVVPRAQSCSFARVPQPERRRFAVHLRDVMRRLSAVVGRAPYNLLLHTAFDSDVMDRDSFRWHLEILPRLAATGGLEWTGQMYVNDTAPEAAADDLRCG